MSKIFIWRRRNRLSCLTAYVTETNLTVCVVIFLQIDFIICVVICGIISYEVNSFNTLWNNVVVEGKCFLIRESTIPILLNYLSIIPYFGTFWWRWRWWGKNNWWCAESWFVWAGICDSNLLVSGNWNPRY